MISRLLRSFRRGVSCHTHLLRTAYHAQPGVSSTKGAQLEVFGQGIKKLRIFFKSSLSTPQPAKTPQPCSVLLMHLTMLLRPANLEHREHLGLHFGNSAYDLVLGLLLLLLAAALSMASQEHLVFSSLPRVGC